ncbi:spore germination protein [Cytobacillus firmus]|jgi:spore germination protein AB|uniref:Spore germination protein n=1 Tax=Cytobacillus firmus TaxID=1399 RepID=A0AA46PZZ7_CYTFI|nr:MULTISPECIES: GerAB/ArcD/ProY family transporter [Cytobacillus]KML46274.1 spore gernimation protein [Cytobacillus firmus]MBU8732318.1 spore germination protein [Cytobacillus oceanisediminis]MCM3241598.1 spore germination protein [Cytobacillus oceanisediminis]MCM3528258.1 spore germination protein [Cytobacillus oceanisediminis]MDK7666497.1 GerAB/ArcD/ProY family transporter [Cytobacillus oceanisediminis]
MKSNAIVNAFMAFFIIHTSQFGMGILGAPRIVYLESKKDAWISVLLSGIAISFITWIMISILKQNENRTLFEIHENLFGRMFGSIINVVIVVYFMAVHYSITISYVELSLTWGYEGLYEWVGVLSLVLITIYGVSGGFRVVAGICFLSFIIVIWMLFVLYQPLQSLNLDRILPILSTSPTEIMNGVYKSSYTMLGFEALLFLFPFFKEKKKVHLYSQLAIWFTTFLVLIITIFSILFFSSKELELNIWPFVSIISTMRFPFIERFEFIVVSIWIIVIFPNLCISLFLSSNGVKQIFRIKQKYGIWIISIIIFICSFFITKRVDNDYFIDKVAQIGFYLWFVYPVVLYGIITIKSKIVGRS